LQLSMDIIISQTNYSHEEAQEMLEKFNGDHIAVIKNYLGISPPTPKPITSVNQEIYRMLRKQIDISSYNEKQSQQFTPSLK
jgi:hypothetical protein